jgi:prepilin peptidase CpaA
MKLTPDLMWNAVVLGFAVTAAISDVGWRKIPRAFTFVALGVGLAFHWATGNGLSAAAAAFVGFGIGLTLFRLGAIGGGDVKLITALGALLGLGRWVVAMEVAVIVAGVIAFIQVCRRGMVRQTFHNMGLLVRGVWTRGLVEHPVVNLRNPSLVRMPFGLAAALGTLAALVMNT